MKDEITILDSERGIGEPSLTEHDAHVLNAVRAIELNGDAVFNDSDIAAMMGITGIPSIEEKDAIRASMEKLLSSYVTVREKVLPCSKIEVQGMPAYKFTGKSGLDLAAKRNLKWGVFASNGSFNDLLAAFLVDKAAQDFAASINPVWKPVVREL